MLLGCIVKLSRRWQTERMKSCGSLYYGHRFPPEIISYAVWHYYRFCLSFRDVESLLAERGVKLTVPSRDESPLDARVPREVQRSGKGKLTGS